MTLTDNTQQGAPTDNSSVDDGGPAFPNTGNSNWNLRPAAGMTLRDWFAGRAMQAQVGAHLSLDSRNYLDGEGMKGLAKEAYAIADAMLAARKGGDQ